MRRGENELHALVRALAGPLREAADGASGQSLDAPETPPHRDGALFEAYPQLVNDQRARTDRTLLEKLEPHLYRVRHVLVDPEEDNAWFVEGHIDLRENPAPEGVLLRLEHLGA